MDKIKVHILNFHNIVSHIEIMLENKSTEPHEYYGINRWKNPCDGWYIDSSRQYFQSGIQQASSTYSFDIEADPNEITRRWKEYWENTRNGANVLGKNCAVAAEWFLTEFAGVPKPSLSNVSWNHLIFGIVWPSFLPCPVTLPGRIMSNAKFHVEARDNPEIASQYSRLFLYTSMSLATLVFSTSVFALPVAATILTDGIAALAISGCAAVGITSTYGFFKAHNILSAKNISDNSSISEQHDDLNLNKMCAISQKIVTAQLPRHRYREATVKDSFDGLENIPSLFPCGADKATNTSECFSAC